MKPTHHNILVWIKINFTRLLIKETYDRGLKPLVEAIRVLCLESRLE